MPQYRKHVFICTQGPFCWVDGDPDGLLEALKRRVAAAGLKDEVRINRAGCLEACGHGPAMVVYPEAVWYGHVTIDDVESIFVSHILNGAPVDHLQLPDDFEKRTEHYPPAVHAFKRIDRTIDEQRRAAQESVRASLPGHS